MPQNCDYYILPERVRFHALGNSCPHASLRGLSVFNPNWFKGVYGAAPGGRAVGKQEKPTQHYAELVKGA
jgi:hypothetical protein